MKAFLVDAEEGVAGTVLLFVAVGTAVVFFVDAGAATTGFADDGVAALECFGLEDVFAFGRACWAGVDFVVVDAVDEALELGVATDASDFFCLLRTEMVDLE